MAVDWRFFTSFQARLNWLSWGAVVIGALPLVASQPAPLEDWPSHLARVRILLAMANGDTFWQAFYHVNAMPLPNIALDLGILALNNAGIPIAWAGTSFLVATYALFVGGAAWLTRTWHADNPLKPPAFAMLFYNGTLMGGFVNYMAGLGLAFGVLAWWRHAGDRTVARYCIASAGAIVVLFAHLGAAVTLIVALGSLELSALAQRRRLSLGSLLHSGTCVAAALVVAIYLSILSTGAGSPARGVVSYRGAPSIWTIAARKADLFVHSLLDGNGSANAIILALGAGCVVLLSIRSARASLPRDGWFLIVISALLVVASPSSVGAAYGLDYRLVIPLAAFVLCTLRLSWASGGARQLALAVLLATSVARSGVFFVAFLNDQADFSAFSTLADRVPEDSVIVTGIGTARAAISWDRFWSPPTEYLATLAASRHVFVPTVFAFASLQPLVLNADYASWRPFLPFGSPAEAAASAARLNTMCEDWHALGHHGSVFIMIAYPSGGSVDTRSLGAVLGSTPAFTLADACRRAS